MSDPSDDARLAELARVVADGIDEALPGWVERRYPVAGRQAARYGG